MPDYNQILGGLERITKERGFQVAAAPVLISLRESPWVDNKLWIGAVDYTVSKDAGGNEPHPAVHIIQTAHVELSTRIPGAIPDPVWRNTANYRCGSRN
ncbi:hypothetical protein HYY74_01010 [Candidatus Woesearchaeota archaeon]|nr:hypothetical protein [Candidatus Woesearchaeota archaeon]